MKLSRIGVGLLLVLLMSGGVAAQSGNIYGLRDDDGATASQPTAGDTLPIRITTDQYGHLWVNVATGTLSLSSGTITTLTPPTAAAIGTAVDGGTNQTAILAATKGVPLDTGVVTTGSGTTTLIDSAKSWTVNGLAGCIVRVMTGTGIGQMRVIASNTSNTLTVATWTAPAAADTYAIYHPISPVVVGSGTAGTAAGGVLTVQGVASMTPILATVTGAVTTSGTVTEASAAAIASDVAQLVDTQAVKTPTFLAAVIIGTPGTPVALAADATYFTSATFQAGRAAAANASLITIGGNTAYTSQRATELAPGDTWTLTPPAGTKWDLNDFYIDGVNTDDGVRIVYVAP